MQATETISEKELQRAQNRLERGMELVWTHAEAIVEVEPGVWSVPASRGGEYRVRLGEHPVCPCRDHRERGGSCKHSTAARIMSEITPAAPEASENAKTTEAPDPEPARKKYDWEEECDYYERVAAEARARGDIEAAREAGAAAIDALL